MAFQYLNLKVVKFLIPEIPGIKISTLKNYRSLRCSDDSGNILVELSGGRSDDFRNIEKVGNLAELEIEPDISGVQTRVLCSEIDGNQITFIRPNATFTIMTKFIIQTKPYELKTCGFEFEVGKYYLIKLRKTTDVSPVVDEDEDDYP